MCNTLGNKTRLTLGTYGKVILILMLSMFAASSAKGADEPDDTAQVPLWTVHQITLHAAKNHPDPFALDLRATFVGPDGRQITIPGFWDGQDTWKLRFSPPTTGVWTWKTTCPDPADAGLHKRTGKLQAVAYSGDNPLYEHGFVKVSPNSRYLVYADGTPLFWVADTNWAINRDFIFDHIFPYTLDRYFAARARQKFNVLQYHIKVGRRVGDFNGWPAPQEQVLTPKFYKLTADRIIHKANANGMVVALFASWAKHFLSTEEKTLAYYRNLVARYGAYHVVWVISGEYAYDDASVELFKKIGRYVKSIDGHAHIATIHPGNVDKRVSSSIDFHNCGWLDFNMIQAYDSYRAAVRAPLVDYKLQPTKPTLEAESMYPRKPGSWYDGDPGRTYQDALWVAYVSVLQGSTTGYTYGGGLHHELNPPSAEYMKHFGGFFRSLNWRELEPHRDWVVGDFKYNPLSRIKPFCAAKRSELYVVYIPKGCPVRQVTITNLSGISYRARRYDPKRGIWSDITERTPAAESWSTPVLPDRSDWLIVLDQPSGQ